MACVELAVAALKPELGVSDRTFTKTASHARALARYGQVGARSITELAAALDPMAEDYGTQLLSLIDQLDLDLALYRRRAHRARALGLQVTDAVEALPFPFYLCDADGTVTYSNAACSALFGRNPQVGVDRWHVAWRLYTMTREHVPLHQCAVALALRGRRQIYAAGFAERPDGSLIRVVSASMPILGSTGVLLGGVNFILERPKGGSSRI